MRSEHGIAEDAADVWYVDLGDAIRQRAPVDEVFGELVASLSAEERGRLERLRTAGLRADFVRTRHVLRQVLARYAGVAPAAIVLRADERGKPHLSPACGVCFSLSHTADVALIGVAGVAVGVDVERIRAVPRMARTARRVLHEATVAQLERLRGAERRRVFIDAWTQREAHVKAVGGGLFMTPDVLPFAASQPADGQARVVTDRMDGEEWSVARFAVGGRCRGTLVARGVVRHVRYIEWNWEERHER